VEVERQLGNASDGVQSSLISPEMTINPFQTDMNLMISKSALTCDEFNITKQRKRVIVSGVSPSYSSQHPASPCGGINLCLDPSELLVLEAEANGPEGLSTWLTGVANLQNGYSFRQEWF
jgi:hypothetical protein